MRADCCVSPLRRWRRGTGRNLPADAREVAAVAAGLRRAVGGRWLRPPPPTIVSRASAAGGWRARYRPRTNTITLEVSRSLPARLRRALIQHELAHWAGRVRCRMRKKRCRYAGEHNAHFYETLAALHRSARTPSTAAREVERRSGYRPPAGWPR